MITWQIERERDRNYYRGVIFSTWRTKIIADVYGLRNPHKSYQFKSYKLVQLYTYAPKVRVHCTVYIIHCTSPRVEKYVSSRNPACRYETVTMREPGLLLLPIYFRFLTCLFYESLERIRLVCSQLVRHLRKQYIFRIGFHYLQRHNIE